MDEIAPVAGSRRAIAVVALGQGKQGLGAMDSAVPRRLAEFIRSEGVGLTEDPIRVRALLLDACPESRTEISLVVAAVEDEIPVRLMRSSDSMMREGEISRAISDLQVTRRLDEGAATWATETWRFALGITTAEPLDPPPVTRSAGSAPSVPTSSVPTAGWQTAGSGGDPGSAGTGAAGPVGPAGGSAESVPSTVPPPPPPAGAGFYDGPWSHGAQQPMLGPMMPPPHPGTPPVLVPHQQKTGKVALIAAIAGVVVLALVIAVVVITQHGNDGHHEVVGPSTSTTQPPTSSPTSSAGVNFSIVDQLGDFETAEVVTVWIGGRNMGQLNVNRTSPSARLSLTGDAAGSYTYELDATVQFPDSNGVLQEVSVTGGGSITVDDGSVYELVVSPRGDGVVVSLREMRT